MRGLRWVPICTGPMRWMEWKKSRAGMVSSPCRCRWCGVGFLAQQAGEEGVSGGVHLAGGVAEVLGGRLGCGHGRSPSLSGELCGDGLSQRCRDAEAGAEGVGVDRSTGLRAVGVGDLPGVGRRAPEGPAERRGRGRFGRRLRLGRGRRRRVSASGVGSGRAGRSGSGRSTWTAGAAAGTSACSWSSLPRPPRVWCGRGGCRRRTRAAGHPATRMPQPGGHVVQVEESGGGDVRAERGGQGDAEPAPGRPGRGVAGPQGADAVPGGDQEQVDADRVGPGFPPGLSGGGGEVVQVREGQGTGDDGLDQHGVEAGQGAVMVGHLLPRRSGGLGHAAAARAGGAGVAGRARTRGRVREGLRGERRRAALQTFTACRSEMSGVRVVTQPPEESPAMASPGPLGGDLHHGGHGVR